MLSQNKVSIDLCILPLSDPVLPQYYYVPDVSAHVHHRHRLASHDGEKLFLWSQSLLIISDLLTSQLLNVHELDPIRRHLPSFSRPKLATKYSAFEVGAVYF